MLYIPTINFSTHLTLATVEQLRPTMRQLFNILIVFLTVFHLQDAERIQQPRDFYMSYGNMLMVS